MTSHSRDAVVPRVRRWGAGRRRIGRLIAGAARAPPWPDPGSRQFVVGVERRQSRAPPYAGSSLDQRICQLGAAGGASSGSGAGSRCRSAPRLTTSSRSLVRASRRSTDRSGSAAKPSQRKRAIRQHRAVDTVAALESEDADPRAAAAADRDAARRPHGARRARRAAACSA